MSDQLIGDKGQDLISRPSQSKAGYAKYSTKNAESAKSIVITRYSIRMAALVGSANRMITSTITNGSLVVMWMKKSKDLGKDIWGLMGSRLSPLRLLLLLELERPSRCILLWAKLEE